MRLTEQDKHGQQRGVSILRVLQAAILETPRGSWIQTVLAPWLGGGATRAPPPDGGDRWKEHCFFFIGGDKVTACRGCYTIVLLLNGQMWARWLQNPAERVRPSEPSELEANIVLFMHGEYLPECAEQSPVPLSMADTSQRPTYSIERRQGGYNAIEQARKAYMKAYNCAVHRTTFKRIIDAYLIRCTKEFPARPELPRLVMRKFHTFSVCSFCAHREVIRRAPLSQYDHKAKEKARRELEEHHKLCQGEKLGKGGYQETTRVRPLTYDLDRTGTVAMTIDAAGNRKTTLPIDSQSFRNIKARMCSSPRSSCSLATSTHPHFCVAAWVTSRLPGCGCDMSWGLYQSLCDVSVSVDEG